MSQLFTSGGQSIGASVSPSVLPMNIQGWFLLGLTGLSSLLFKKISKSLLQHYNLKASVLWHSVFFMCQLSNLYIITGEIIASSIEAFVRKRMSSPLNMISMFVIAFFPKNKYLLMSWLQSPSTVILEPPKNKICNSFHFSPFYLLWSDGTKCHDLSFFNVEFQASFFTLLFHPQQEAL